MLLLPTATAAQETVTKSLTSATCASSSSTGCVYIGAIGRGGVGVQVTGTFSGTLQFEGSVNGTNFSAINATPPNSTTAVTSTTATGQWQIAAGGMSYIRVRFSSYSSGTAVVTLRAAPTTARGGGGSISGSIADTQIAVGDGADSIAGSSALTFTTTGGAGLGLVYSSSATQAYGTNVALTSTSTASGNAFANNFRVTATPSGNTAMSYYGLYGAANAFDKVANVYSHGLTGAFLQANNGGVGVIDDVFGVVGDARNYGEGTVSNLSAGWFFVDNEYSVISGIMAGVTVKAENYGETVPSLRLVDLSLDANADSGVLTDTYGVYIGDVTSGTQTNQAYGLYQADPNARNHFAGNTTLAQNVAYAALAVSATAPTVASGFCTSPVLSTPNGTAAFVLTVGTSCSASTGTLTMPEAANGWACYLVNTTDPGDIPVQTGGTTTTVTVENYSRTSGMAANFTDSDVLRVLCTGY